jgi:hypothetical protein
VTLHRAVHLNLDDAWTGGSLPVVDATKWGRAYASPRQLRRSSSSSSTTSSNSRPLRSTAPATFHHLTALLIRRVRERVVVVSFDNHPDWDIRPPWWCCGSWVNRALELPQVQKVAVWGCGNFECWWPGQAFGNRRAEREGKLDVHPWADDRPDAKQKRPGAIFRATWRDEFERFVTLAQRRERVRHD